MDRRRWAITAIAAGAVAAYLGWRGIAPAKTSERLFRARCTTCHELPDVCRFDRSVRPNIVDIMRTERGAREVISDSEAAVIKHYLEHELRCP